MSLFNEKIMPFQGTETIKLYSDINNVKSILDKATIPYTVEKWESEYETIPNPWTVITVADTISLFFAKNNKLFKIVFWKNYTGSLPNGITTLTNIKKAELIDKTLRYDDWNEDYESENGYWIEDDVEANTVLSISIFIKEMLDEDSFDKCLW